MSIRVRYFLIGALFGMCFPVMALIVEFQRLSLAFSIASFGEIHAQNPILYMIDTAPLFLGLFALIGGISKEKSILLIRQFKTVADYLSQNTNKLKRQSEESLSDYIDSLNQLSSGYSSIDQLNRSTYSEINTTLEGTSKVGTEIDRMKGSLDEIAGYNTHVRNNHTRISEYLGSYLGNIKKLNEYFSYLNDFSREIEMLAINSSIEANKHGAAGKAFQVFASDIQKLAQETKSRNTEVLQLMHVVSDETSKLNESINTERENIENIIKLAENVNEAASDFDEVIRGFISSLQEATEHLNKQNNLTTDFGSTLKGIHISNREIMKQLQEVVSKQVSIIHQMDEVAATS